MCHNRTYTLQTNLQLFDHLIGAGEERRGNVDADRLGGFQIDHEIELGCLLDRQLAGLIVSEDAADIDAGLTMRINEVRTIAPHSPGFDKTRKGAEGRQFLADRERRQIRAVLYKKSI